MKRLSFILMVIFTSFLNAQELTVDWTDLQHYDKKVDGFFDEYVGANSKYVYTKYDNRASGFRKWKMKLVTYDKKTMSKAGSVTLFDGKDVAKAKKYEDLKYYKTIIFEKTVYVFWANWSKKKDELYVESLDENLNPISPLKKIYELTSSKQDNKKAALFVMGNKFSNERIVIGGELAADKGEKVRIEYKLLNSDFTFFSSHQVELPISITGKSSSLTSSYELGNDGNLHIKSYVSMSREEKKSAQKNEATVYPIYSVVELASGAIKSYPMKFNDKNLFDFDFIVSKNSIKIFGFFCDLKKDPKGVDNHGIFYSVIDPATFTINAMNFSYFTKVQLDHLFAKDISDRKDNSTLRSKKKAQSEEQSIPDNYSIEDVQSVDGDNLVLFCSRMQNGSYRSCDSKGHCTTYYYCKKSNVTAFRLNAKGEIIWASNLDRKYTYAVWDVKDVKVINKDGFFYVTYASTPSKEKKRADHKKKETKFEYGVFDYATGKASKKDFLVNGPNTPKKEKKCFFVTDIIKLDNEFYLTAKPNFSTRNLKPKTGHLGYMKPRA